MRRQFEEVQVDGRHREQISGVQLTEDQQLSSKDPNQIIRSGREPSDIVTPHRRMSRTSSASVLRLTNSYYIFSKIVNLAEYPKGLNDKQPFFNSRPHSMQGS